MARLHTVTVACSALIVLLFAVSAIASSAPIHGLSEADPCVHQVEALIAACQSKCPSETSEIVAIKCHQQCYEKGQPALLKCAETKPHRAIPSSSPRPQPRPFTENEGYGPETVLNWGGYVSVNGSQPTLKRHMFYWFFESRNEPSTDPLVLWLTGGPGCSSMMALFMENGPYIINPTTLNLTLNPYSWNSNASVIWLDQPVNTGFSYADFGDIGPFNEADIAMNIYEMLQGFFEQYPKYANLPFFVTGESYAGHYVPATAHVIQEMNAQGDYPQINLQAIAIGNGLVDPFVQYQEYAPFAAATGAVNGTGLQIMQAGIQPCMTLIAACNQSSTLGLMACMEATSSCNGAEMMPFQFTGKNVYDIREQCKVPPLCYDFSYVTTFLNQASVQAALGVPAGHTWVDCNRAVDMGLVFAGDWMRNLAVVVPSLLAANIRVIVYSGEYDFICNWYGGQAWSNQLTWPGQNGFINAQNTTWMVDGEYAGTSRTNEGLTFVRVANAGHMVPLNVPGPALDLLARVISGAPFDESPSILADEIREVQVATE